jgi:hypothetical protein
LAILLFSRPLPHEDQLGLGIPLPHYDARPESMEATASASLYMKGDLTEYPLGATGYTSLFQAVRQFVDSSNEL